MKGKLYCPYCKLELLGNEHLSDNEAWEVFNCEYRVSDDDKPPIPELEINKREIERLTKRKNAANKRIRELIARNSELEN